MKRLPANPHTQELEVTGLDHILPEIKALIESARQHGVSTANLTLVWLNPYSPTYRQRASWKTGSRLSAGCSTNRRYSHKLISTKNEDL